MRVAELWRYPVKSLRGESLEGAQVLGDGFEGDRLAEVVDEHGNRVTGRTAPGLLGLQGGVGADGRPVVEGAAWDGVEARASVAAMAGRGAALVARGRHHDAAPVLVVTDGALAALGEDRRRFRANVVVSGVGGLTEREWVASQLRLGGVTLLVRETCERCVMTTIDPDTMEQRLDVLRRIKGEFDGVLGVYCEVVVPGDVAVGDPVEVSRVSTGSGRA